MSPSLILSLSVSFLEDMMMSLMDVKSDVLMSDTIEKKFGNDS